MSESKNYAAYATKEITPTMAAFCEWLESVTGTKLDARSVALAGSLRMDFQKSDFWKKHPSNYLANVEANRAANAAKRVEAAKASAAKAAARLAKVEDDAKKAVAAAKAKAAKAEQAAA